MREGTDVTIVTYGATVQRAFAAANQLAEERGIDGRGDRPALAVALGPGARSTRRVKKTNRVIVAYEDSISWGYGAEIAARIADDCFAWLDAPVKRVASTDTFVGYAPRLEDAILPQVERLQAGDRGNRALLALRNSRRVRRAASAARFCFPWNSTTKKGAASANRSGCDG